VERAECRLTPHPAPSTIAAIQVHALHLHDSAVFHWIIIGDSKRDIFWTPPQWSFMRSRDRILGNLESIYRESYDRAKKAADDGRMMDLESGYMRDQLMLEILLDIRDLFSVAPAATGSSALEKLESIRRLTKLR
jgi:hypothetical protein